MHQIFDCNNFDSLTNGFFFFSIGNIWNKIYTKIEFLLRWIFQFNLNSIWKLPKMTYATLLINSPISHAAQYHKKMLLHRCITNNVSRNQMLPWIVENSPKYLFFNSFSIHKITTTHCSASLKFNLSNCYCVRIIIPFVVMDFGRITC